MGPQPLARSGKVKVQDMGTVVPLVPVRSKVKSQLGIHDPRGRMRVHQMPSAILGSVRTQKTIPQPLKLNSKQGRGGC
jgi:hypothetical protein